MLFTYPSTVLHEKIRPGDFILYKINGVKDDGNPRVGQVLSCHEPALNSVKIRRYLRPRDLNTLPEEQHPLEVFQNGAVDSYDISKVVGRCFIQHSSDFLSGVVSPRFYGTDSMEVFHSHRGVSATKEAFVKERASWDKLLAKEEDDQLALTKEILNVTSWIVRTFVASPDPSRGIDFGTIIKLYLKTFPYSRRPSPSILLQISKALDVPAPNPKDGRLFLGIGLKEQVTTVDARSLAMSWVHATYSFNNEGAYISQSTIWEAYRAFTLQPGAPQVQAAELFQLDDPPFQTVVLPSREVVGSIYAVSGLKHKTFTTDGKQGGLCNAWFLHLLRTNYERDPLSTKSPHVTLTTLIDEFTLEHLPYPGRLKIDLYQATLAYFRSSLGLKVLKDDTDEIFVVGPHDLLGLRRKKKNESDATESQGLDDVSGDALTNKRSSSHVLQDQVDEEDQKPFAKRRRDSGYQSSSEPSAPPSRVGSTNANAASERSPPRQRSPSLFAPSNPQSPPHETLVDSVRDFIEHMIAQDPIRAAAYADSQTLLLDALITPDQIQELGLAGLERLGLKTGVALKMLHALRTSA